MENKIQSSPIMFTDPIEDNNALSKWAKGFEEHDRLLRNRRNEAISIAIDCVNDGTLTKIDGPNSVLSCQIKDFFKCNAIEMNSNWITSSQHWICPCCGRGKFDIAKKGKKEQIVLKLVIHHDHIEDALKAAFERLFIDLKIDTASKTGLFFIERMAPAFSVYDPILICEDCNNADAKAKQWLKENKKANIEFHSFSIGQIRYFIKPLAHSSHDIDYDLLEEIWGGIKPAYIARMKLIYEVAKAAITQDFWYEKYPTNYNPIPSSIATRAYSSDGVSLISEGLYVQEVKRHTHKHISNWTRWRTENNQKKVSLSPPDNYLAIINSFPGCSQSWNSVADDWCCPICKKTKYQQIINDSKKVRFNTHTIGRIKVGWTGITIFCAQCFAVIAAIKRELRNDHGLDIQYIYDYITAEQLFSIISPVPNAPHLIDQDAALILIDQILLKKVP